jgi:Putative Flp pilus-assembly TadE/G-like
VRHVIRRALGHLVRRDDGVALVKVALWMPLMVLLMSLVVDVGNWFVHRRHLQMQADAAAFAAAGDYRVGCGNGDAVNDTMRATARKYGGVTTGGVAAYNGQLGTTPHDKVDIRINARHWPWQDGTNADTTVREGDPCGAGMIDVKLTERDLPWFFRLANVAFINAHARVEFKKSESTLGGIPIGVPLPAFRSVKAIFVDETKAADDSARVLATVPLTEGDTAEGVTWWDGTSAPGGVAVDSPHVGVRIVVAEGGSTTCGDEGVTCYDADGDEGVAHVRGWSAPPAGGLAPAVRDVRLLTGTCPDDPYFTANTGTCRFGVSAAVDFGGDPSALGARVTAVADGHSVPLRYDSATGDWSVDPTVAATTGEGLDLTAGSGAVRVDLQWAQEAGTRDGQACKPGGGNPCKGTITGAQRAFSATEARSGPVREVQVSSTGELWGANSFERSPTTRPLGVRVGVRALTSGPKVVMRVGSGGQTQALNCDPDVQGLSTEFLPPDPRIPQGCNRRYTVNQGESCPATKTELHGSPEPWSCVNVALGATPNEIPQGLNVRILGDERASTCTAPNRWPDYERGDPRLVKVFLTPYSAFTGSGQDVLPIKGFAGFYVTGWTGSGASFRNPCTGNGDESAPDDGSGYIVGHFVQYLDTVNEGGATEESCESIGFGVCVAVLTI